MDNYFSPTDMKEMLVRTTANVLTRPNYALDLTDPKLPTKSAEYYQNFNISIPRRIAMQGYRAV